MSSKSHLKLIKSRRKSFLPPLIWEFFDLPRKNRYTEASGHTDFVIAPEQQQGSQQGSQGWQPHQNLAALHTGEGPSCYILVLHHSSGYKSQMLTLYFLLYISIKPQFGV